MTMAASEHTEPAPDQPGPDHRADALPAVVPPAVRSWLYGIVLALIPVLVALGYLRDDLAPLLIALASAVLAVGTATAYRPTRAGIRGRGGADE